MEKSNWFHKLRNAFGGTEKSIENPSTPVFEALQNLNLTDSSVSVGHDTAIQSSAFFNGIMQIGDSLASYPKAVMNLEGGFRRKIDHELNEVLREPNEGMTQFQFFHTMQYNALSWGNAIAYIEYKNKRTRSGRPYLRLAKPSSDVLVSLKDGMKFYDIELYDGRKLLKVPDRDVIHVMGVSQSGYWGVDVVTNFKNTLGLGLSQEKFNSEFYKNGTSAAGYIKVPVKLVDGAGEKIGKDFKEKYAGLGNHHSIPVLGAGSEFVQLSVNPEAAQFLQSRQFSIEEIARMLNMPPHKLKHLLYGTYNNVETLETSYNTTTMMPWVIRFEEELTKKLLTEEEKRTHIIDFDMNNILRADIQAKAAFYDAGIKGQWLVPNEPRTWEGLNPLPGGDTVVDFQKTQMNDNNNKPKK